MSEPGNAEIEQADAIEIGDRELTRHMTRVIAERGNTLPEIEATIDPETGVVTVTGNDAEEYLRTELPNALSPEKLTELKAQDGRNTILSELGIQYANLLTAAQSDAGFAERLGLYMEKLGWIRSEPASSEPSE